MIYESTSTTVFKQDGKTTSLATTVVVIFVFHVTIISPRALITPAPDLAMP